MIINRTLVYGLVSATMLVYSLLVAGGQHVVAGLVGPGNKVVLVVSTLAIFVLFHPIRNRIQCLVDRRFYRSKYDAGQVMASFSETVRQEVNLDQPG